MRGNVARATLLVSGKNERAEFQRTVKICQETATELPAIYLSEGRPYQQLWNAQGHTHSGVATATPVATNHAANPIPGSSGNGHSSHSDAMDLSDATGTHQKTSEEERMARLHDGRCLYGGGIGHMVRNWPIKSRNPVRAVTTQIELDRQADPNTLTHPNTSTLMHVNTFSGGGTRGGNGGNQGQSGNA